MPNFSLPSPKRLVTTRRLGLVTLAVALAYSSVHQAHAVNAMALSYAGRLVDASGEPLGGSTDLVLRFYREASGGAPLVADQNYTAVPLAGGVFQVDLALSAADLALLFGDGSSAAYVEVTAGDKTYPRQRYLAVPMALRVPIDESLAFDDSGRLGVATVPSNKVSGLTEALAGKATADHGHTLGGDLSGSVGAATVAKLQGRPVSTTEPTTNQVLQWTGSQWAPANSGGGVATLAASAPLVVTGGATTPTLSLPQAAGGSAGYLSASDWSTFNAKLAGLSGANGVAVTTSGVSATVGLANTGVTAASYDLASITVDAQGRITAATSGSVDLGSEVAGILPVTSGGTGLSSAPANGQFAIGNGSGFALGSLTGGTGLTVTNGAGSISIAATIDPATLLPKAGGSMSGALNMGGFAISGLATPTDASYATTKSYSDAYLGGVNFDQTSRVNDYVIKWDNTNSKFMLAADQVGSAGGGITAFNGLGASSQTLAVGSSGTAPAFSSNTSTHTLNIPHAQTGSVTAGLISNSEYQTFNNKIGSVASGTGISVSTAGTTATVNLANTAVSAGSYTRANITVDAQGRLTAATSGSSIDLASDVTGTVAIVNGGTGATTAAAARSALGLGSIATASTIYASQIATGTITDNEISASAAIADSKLATISTAGKVANSATTATNANTASAIVARDASGNFSAGTITATLSGNASTATTAGNVSGTVAIANGGTGATTAAAARSALSAAASGANSDITALSGLTTAITLAQGGTGGTTAALARTNLGLGSLATASSINASQITAGTITNTEISGSAAIATSKISGPVTSVASHGLGALATLSAVGSAEISNSSIVDADISGSAAISSSKISFVSDGISGNAIDGGTISNFASTGIDDNAASTAMTINSAGNVGIGTTSPPMLLYVNASAGIWPNQGVGVESNGANAELRLKNSSAAGHDYVLNSGGTGAGVPGAFYIYDNTAASHRFILDGNGNVGIGTTAPTSILTINGAARNAASILNSTSTINFASGNLQYTNASCGAFILHNLKDGGSYTLSVKGATSATCSFTAYSDAGVTALTMHLPPDHAATTASKHTLYNFMVIGTDAYASWTPGY